MPTVKRSSRSVQPGLFYCRGRQKGARKNQCVRSSSKFTITLFCQESGPGFAFLRLSKSSTACVTSINRVCRLPRRWLLAWSRLGWVSYDPVLLSLALSKEPLTFRNGDLKAVSSIYATLDGTIAF